MPSEHNTTSVETGPQPSPPVAGDEMYLLSKITAMREELALLGSALLARQEERASVIRYVHQIETKVDRAISELGSRIYHLEQRTWRLDNSAHTEVVHASELGLVDRVDVKPKLTWVGALVNVAKAKFGALLHRFHTPSAKVVKRILK